MSRTVSYAAALLFAGFASAASAKTMPSNEYEMDVLRSLNTAWRENLYPGYAFAQPEILGSADALQVRPHEVALRSGADYLIVVVCDDDCSDIDIRAYTEGGAEAAYDEAGARRRLGFASIMLSPLTSQTYRLDVDMFSCTNEPCYYAIGVFVADQGGAVPTSPPDAPDHSIPALQ
ncbi:MAG: hypothetical protein RJB62_15 [Pseudomonadota bacterium]|jgi:hypothetical protein